MEPRLRLPIGEEWERRLKGRFTVETEHAVTVVQDEATSVVCGMTK